MSEVKDHDEKTDVLPELETPSDNVPNHLHRRLSGRQVQMIAIAGTIGTGLFLGTGKALATGGPASLLICYSIVGFIVYITLLLLGEMATQYPVAGSFSNYAIRFVSPSYGFALGWNYWLNDAITLASDLTAAQLVLEYWIDPAQHPTWPISLAFWVALVGVNAVNVRAYGELEYWLSTLKVATVIVFIIVGIAVNAGGNTSHHYIGGENWRIDDAPFIGGFGGFASVFVTASFAYGGTESLGVTAGETINPTKTMPRVVKMVFFRILLFYILSILLVGLNVPYNFPGLSTRSSTTSPFTIIFQQAGSRVAGSFVNTVILTSVLSAGNHTLFLGTRVLYSLALPLPRAPGSTAPLVRFAPAIFSRTTRSGVPIYALALTAAVGALCFGSSFVGSGQLWGWLQNFVGVAGQIAWLSIGLASWRFRDAWVKQGRPLEEMKFRAGWTWGWGAPFVVISNALLVLIQGWSCFSPRFVAVDFVSLYIEIPIMLVMTVGWAVFRRTRGRMDPDMHVERKHSAWSGLVNTQNLDLYRDEYDEDVDDERRHNEETAREKRMAGPRRILWKLYYAIV